MDEDSDRDITIPQSGRVEITYSEMLMDILQANYLSINGELAHLVSVEPLLELQSVSYVVILHEADFNYSLDHDKKTIPIYKIDNYIYITDVDYKETIEVGTF